MAVEVTIKYCGIKYCDHWKKQSKSDISCIPGALWDKVIDFTDELVVQCDVPAVKNTSLYDDNDYYK